MELLDNATWLAAGAWGITLVAINVMFHVFFLRLISESIYLFHARLTARRYFESKFATIMGVAATMATALHGIEASIRAVAPAFRAGGSTGQISVPVAAQASSPSVSCVIF